MDDRKESMLYLLDHDLETTSIFSSITSAPNSRNFPKSVFPKHVLGGAYAVGLLNYVFNFYFMIKLLEILITKFI